MNHQGMKEQIDKLLLDLIGIKSDTGTVFEQSIESYIYEWLSRLEYFRHHSEHFGLYQLENDPLERSIVWALAKGNGKKTVILLHHHDVVDALDYGRLIPWAYDPVQLSIKLSQTEVGKEVKDDIESGEWIFARGSADMKAGAAIQMALLEEYSKQKELYGNVLLLSVPDEESLSTGMRQSLKLLEVVKKTYDLDYTLLIDSEPHQREDGHTGILYGGSVGKLMPVIYVRGKKTHIGDIYEGFNPILLLSKIVEEVELNTEFSDVVGNEVSPPPSWSYCRDRKVNYDASIPQSAGGYFSILTLNRTPKTILNQLQHICTKAFQEIVNRTKKNYEIYLIKGHQNIKELPWKVNVKTFAEIYQEAMDNSGKAFIEDFKESLTKLKNDIDSCKINITEGTFVMIEKTLEYTTNSDPVIVIAFSPPFYPHVSNALSEKVTNKLSKLLTQINNMTQKEWQENYVMKDYFMGISDMSYVMLQQRDEVIPYIGLNMPLWKSMYDISFETMERLSIPIINIGPWGKDLHKLTERVYKPDVYSRIPKILSDTIEFAFRNL